MTTLDSSLVSALRTSGVQLTIGPFLVHVRSSLPGVRNYLDRFYGEFPVRDARDGHFSVSVVPGRGLRRWIRPQAISLINGARPFYPLPGNLAGPLFEWALNWAIGRVAHRWVVVHAAVVERGGRAMIFPAEPGAGKSTLSAALTYSGWRFLSDEFAMLDPATGLVWPMPRPISLKDGAIEIIRARHPDVIYGPEGTNVDDERFVHAKPPVSSITRVHEAAVPAWIVTPRYRAGAPTSIVPVARAHALVQLAGQSFNYNYLGVTGYETLVRAIEHAQCFTLEYSDLDDVIARLTEMTDS